MSDVINKISPVYIGEDRFVLTVDPISLPLLSYNFITININYDDADPEGVVLPLIATIQPAFGDGTGYIRKVYKTTAPSSLTFQASVGAGDYLVTVREWGHNRWQGRLVVTVAGDDYSEFIEERRT